MRRRLLYIMLLLTAYAPHAVAHEVRPAYLELRQTAADTFDVLWKVPALGDNMRLGLYVRLPETSANLAEPRGRFAADAYIERWSIRHAKALVGSTISIDGLQTTLTDVLVRIERLDGTTQVARLLPTSPSLVVEASPSGWEVIWLPLVCSRLPGVCVRDFKLRDGRHANLVFGISYRDNINSAQQLLEEIVRDPPLVLDKPKPLTQLDELEESSVNFICPDFILKCVKEDEVILLACMVNTSKRIVLLHVTSLPCFSLLLEFHLMMLHTEAQGKRQSLSHTG